MEDNLIFSCEIIHCNIEKMLDQKVDKRTKIKIASENPNFYEEVFVKVINEHCLYYALMMDEEYTDKSYRDQYIKDLSYFIKYYDLNINANETNFRINKKSLDEISRTKLNEMWMLVEERLADSKKILLHRKIETEEEFMWIVKNFYEKMEIENFLVMCKRNNISFCILTYLDNYDIYTKHFGLINDGMDSGLIETSNITEKNIEILYEKINRLKLSGKIRNITIRHSELDACYKIIKDLFESKEVSNEDFVNFINVNPVESSLIDVPRLIKNTSITRMRDFSFEALKSLFKVLDPEIVGELPKDDKRRSSINTNWVFVNNEKTNEELTQLMEEVKKTNTNRLESKMMMIRAIYSYNYEFNDVYESKGNMRLRPYLENYIKKEVVERSVLLKLQNKSSKGEYSYFSGAKTLSISNIFQTNTSILQNNLLVSVILSKNSKKDILKVLMDYESLSGANLIYIKLYKGFAYEDKRAIENSIKMKGVFSQV